MAHNVHHDNVWREKGCAQHAQCLRMVQSDAGRTEHHFLVAPADAPEPEPQAKPRKKAPARKAAARKK